MSADLSDVPAELRGAVSASLEVAEVQDGHLAVQIVHPDRIRELNREHRGMDRATDVLAFPVDSATASPGPRELGDVVVCPEECSSVREAVVHGVLHLCGYDHEVDGGEMLDLQARAMAALQRPGGPRMADSRPPDAPGSAGRW